MRSPRDIEIERAILTALSNVPADLLLDESTLRADAARAARPRATTVELDAALSFLDQRRRIAGIAGETEMQWQITHVGRLWLAQNR